MCSGHCASRFSPDIHCTVCMRCVMCIYACVYVWSPHHLFFSSVEGRFPIWSRVLILNIYMTAAKTLSRLRTVRICWFDKGLWPKAHRILEIYISCPIYLCRGKGQFYCTLFHAPCSSQEHLTTLRSKEDLWSWIQKDPIVAYRKGRGRLLL